MFVQFRFLRHLVIILMAAKVMACPAFAEPTNATEPTREQLLTQISIMQDYIKTLEGELRNRPKSSDPMLEKAYLETRMKQYEYLREVFDINLNAFRAQRIASTVVLALVVLVVVAGVAFAGFQLWKSVSIAVTCH